ncbi:MULTISPECIES: lytic polysaccharide monooxygenase [unclassified Francisella]|uniref:lytic polysaccharide monooxygenase n=1 Tax=unclassified Francisella TaxID=2610885 RepID=UPI002E33213A|nr:MULTISPECIES: lytic polysaccharide monooxygenase [unclassified Francisella]MED7818597.1 lytic polysaccharide monooxygenase [Francisella sp. 19S2-4]MED7829433.1 lytic polysaccharide monooxygenase [Francisella sp. 19S2-10]
MKLNKITLLTGLSILASSQAYSHGYVESPAARAYLCKTGQNINCGGIMYEPQSLEAGDRLFNNGQLDNKMGSVGRDDSIALDEQQESRWTKTVVASGQPLNIKWYFTANHSSRHFKFYITKQNWNPNELLTRDSFEDQPLNCYDPQPFWKPDEQPNKEGLTFTCTMPERTGYQVIMAEWDVADTEASFYNLIDVYFTNEHAAGTIILPEGDIEASTGIPTYDPNKEYPNKGTEVVYEGKVYKSQWWVNPGENPPGQNNVWVYVRDYEEESPVNPNDKYPIEVTRFNLNPSKVKEGDIINLELAKASDNTLEKIKLLDVPANMSPENLLKTLAEKVNELSSQQLNDALIAGEKNAEGAVIPSTTALYIYQTADKPYNHVGFEHDIADQNLVNELHLMDFNNAYTLDSSGNLNINAKIMSHSSEEVDVTVTLQDKDGNQVYRKDDIKIAPTDTYDLNMKVENLSAGDYELIIYSQLPGAQAWQEDLDITVNEYSETTGEDISKYPEYKANTVYNSGDIVSNNGELYQCKTNVAAWCSGAAWAYAPGTGSAWQQAWNLYEATSNETNENPSDNTHLVNVDIEAKTPYYQVNSNNTVTARTWYSNIGSIDLDKNQITIVPWDKVANNDSSDYVKCPKPNGNQTSILYLVEGDLNNVTCRIK